MEVGGLSHKSFFRCHPPLIFDTGFPPNWNLSKQTSLPGQRTPGICLSLLPQHWDYTCTAPHLTFYTRGSWITLTFSHLQGKCSTISLSYLPGPGEIACFCL